MPQIAAVAGVSIRTFNNYFASKEQAIASLAGRRAAGVATGLRDRPATAPLGQVLIEAIASVYHQSADQSFPQNFLRDYQELVVREPALQGAHLAAVAAAERDLADAIAERAPALRQLKSP